MTHERRLTAGSLTWHPLRRQLAIDPALLAELLWPSPLSIALQGDELVLMPWWAEWGPRDDVCPVVYPDDRQQPATVALSGELARRLDLPPHTATYRAVISRRVGERSWAIYARPNRTERSST